MRFEAEDLVVRYPGSRAPALDGVEIQVPTGLLYAVLGPNGSGKSTLMRALLGVVRPERGEARVDGRPVSSWDRRELARNVGAVPQVEAMPFPVSVRDLVGMGRFPHLGPLRPEGPEDRAAVAEALERCDVTHLALRNVQTLSGGELQRVRIARALAQRPRALVLDEPTSSLDVRHEMGILGLLRKAADEGTTVLLITHHLDLAARFADRIMLMDCGRAVAEGAPDDVYTEAILEQVYRWPVAVRLDDVTGRPRVIPRNVSPDERPGGPPP